MIDEKRIYRTSAKRYKNGLLSENQFIDMYNSYKSIYTDYLTNVVTSLFKYNAVPDTLNTYGLEFLLRVYGYANIVCIDKDNVFLNSAITEAPNFNLQLGNVFTENSDSELINDLLHGKSPKQLNRFNISEIKNSGQPFYVTLFNKRSFYNGYVTNDIDLITRTAETLAEIKASTLSNIRQQKTPFVGFTSDGNLSAKKIWENLETGKPFINVDSEMFGKIDDVIKTFPVQTPNLAPTLHDSWNNTLYEFLTMVGISNTNVDKKERLVASEADGNNGLINTTLHSYLDARQGQLNLINKVLDSNFTVSLNHASIDGVTDMIDNSNDEEESANDTDGQI